MGRLATGVPGLDALLCGGLVAFSFNLIAGAPGSGKTPLAHQSMFALANWQRKALFFTVLGEPWLKMLARIVDGVERFEPALVFVDSFRAVEMAAQATPLLIGE